MFEKRSGAPEEAIDALGLAICTVEEGADVPEHEICTLEKWIPVLLKSSVALEKWSGGVEGLRGYE